MIYSMTAFARMQSECIQGNLVCEIRSINHRYLEASVYLPDMLRSLEMNVRDNIRNQVKRGKIDCVIRYQANAAYSEFSINEPLAREVCRVNERIAEFLTAAAPIQSNDILRFPGVLQTEETDVSQLQAEVIALVAKTLKELVTVRAREGGELKQLFIQRLDAIQQELVKVRERLPQVMVDQRERLLKRFMDAQIELDDTRLEQEMVMFAQRIDVAEEIDRTETHVAEIRRILQEGGTIGRRLDFLLQELNREANTMGSKSVDSVITHAAVEIKVLIEQIREQVQNIE